MTPDPPTNARMAYADGTIIPLELRYAGLDNDGFHLWIATARVELDPTCELLVDKVPPRTSIEIHGPSR